MKRRYSLSCLLLLFFCGPLLAASDDHFLDVSIELFTREAEHAPAVDGAGKTRTSKADPVQAVLLTETRLLPMYLRYRLEQSNRFGAVRVVGQPDLGADLRITGRILKSDGDVLDLAIKAQDSSGRSWLDRNFHGVAVPKQSLTKDDPLAEDDFAGLFGDIVAALRQQAEQVDARQYDNIHNVALLRYGLGLVPTAFAPYLDEGKDGTVTVKQLPARDDPLLKRILAIREREYRFIDVVDENYGRFYAKAQPLYAKWREAQREQLASSTERNKEALANAGGYQRGSYHALMQSYNNYGWVKLQELYVDELGEGFTNEIEPTQMALNDSMFRLTGTLDQQYREWRTILAQLFELDKQ